MDTRVHDFLNDKIQTFSDFETLDLLIHNVQSQQALLHKQLQDARAEVHSAEDASLAQSNQRRQRAIAYSDQQGDVDRRLQQFTGSSNNEDAAGIFAKSIGSVRSYEAITQYQSVFNEVELLDKQARAKLTAVPEEALAAYKKLMSTFNRVTQLHKDAHHAAPHFPAYVQKVAWQLRESMRESLSADLTKALEKILWPKRDMLEGSLPESVRKDIETSVSRLLELQKPELEREQEQRSDGEEPDSASAVLFPAEVLAGPLVQRFQYHFSGERPTNRLDKPQYFLTHFLDTLEQYVDFVSRTLQPCLFQTYRQSPLALNTAYFDATTAWVIALLPMLRNKLLELLPRISKQPQLLSHLVHELLTFDATLRDEWRFDGGTTASSPSPWKGLTWEVLVRHSWFEHWLTVEKDFALARYQTIVDDPTAAALDLTHNDDASSDQPSRPLTAAPTKSAVRLLDLLTTVSSTYKPLPSFSHRLRFLIDVHVALLDRFHERLRSALEAFLALTSSLGRTVQGHAGADLHGLTALDRICRVYGPADFLERAMRDWSDDLFFVDLWSLLQARVRDSQSRGGRVAGALRIADVAPKTSASLAVAAGGQPDDDAAALAPDDSPGSIFDETAAAYADLRARAESTLTDSLAGAVRDALRPYARLNGWNVASSGEDAAAPSTVSAELTPALQVLAESLGFLAKAVGPLALRRLAKAAAAALDQVVFDRVVLPHTFDVAGGRQVVSDLAAVAAVLERYVGAAGIGGMRRCRQAGRLLALPVGGGGVSSADGMDGEDEDDAWDTAGHDVRGGEHDLWSVERRLFADNDSARALLEEMGMGGWVGVGEARSVVRCRVELG